MAAEVNLDRESLPPGPFRRPLPARLRLPAGRGAPVEEERDAARIRAFFVEFFYQTPARGMVVVSAYGGKAQEIRYKISLHAD